MTETIPSSPSQEKTHQAQTGPDWSILESVSRNYGAQERARVDRIKEEIEKGWDNSYYEERQIDIPPSLIRKFGRIALDSLGIKSLRSEERREREATAIALREHQEEMEARWLAQVENRRNEEEAARRRTEEEAARLKQLERQSLLRGMYEGREFSEWRKADLLEKQRIQELEERDLNSRLLTVDHLEDEIMSGNPEVLKEEIKYGDKEIPVYHLRGIPFSMLTHTVDYRRVGIPGSIGTDTYRAVMDDPRVWAERLDIAEHDSGFGTRRLNARGNTISTSYTNSEHNLNTRVPGNLVYGFDHVEAGSIMKVADGDGGTPNMLKKDSVPQLYNLGAIKRLEEPKRIITYNEVLLRRYSENGLPKLPDYIVTEDGKISEVALRHADYFRIPIINIYTDIYREQSRIKEEVLVDSISEDDDHQDMQFH